jgi:PAS domain S-box-containing protein
VYKRQKEGRCTFINDAAQKMLGYKSNECLNKNIYELIHKIAGPNKIGNWFEKMLTHGKVTRLLEEHYRDKEGKIHTVLLSSSPIVNNGAITGGVVSLIDNQQLKRAETALKESEHKLMILAESDVIGIMFGDVHGKINYANDKLLQMIGYDRESMNKGELSWVEITPKELIKLDIKAQVEAQKRGSCDPYEKELITKMGSRIPVLVGFTLYGESRDKMVAFVLDISEQKDAERQKDDFISMASHELKTPITTIKALTQMLNKYYFIDDQKGKNQVQLMEVQIERLSKLVNELLDVSKIKLGRLEYKKEPFVLSNLAKEIVANMQEISESHKLELLLESESMVYADKDKITQVMVNLLSNAIKYSPGKRDVGIRIYERDGKVYTSIKDRGVGIDKNDQDKIFQRYYRSKSQEKKFPGLGIGLYVSKEIVNKHGGDLELTSLKGKGSTFSFWLPINKKHGQKHLNGRG